MNDSTIRVQADLITINLSAIAAATEQLQRSFDVLYEELETCDPQRGRDFEHFLLHLTRTLHALRSDHVTALAQSAAAMRAFASGSEVGRAVPGEPSAPVVAARCAASAPVGRAVPEQPEINLACGSNKITAKASVNCVRGLGGEIFVS